MAFVLLIEEVWNHWAASFPRCVRAAAVGAAFALALAVGCLVVFGASQAARLLRATSLRGMAVLCAMPAQHRATWPQPELEIF